MVYVVSSCINVVCLDLPFDLRQSIVLALCILFTEFVRTVVVADVEEDESTSSFSCEVNEGNLN